MLVSYGLKLFKDQFQFNDSLHFELCECTLRTPRFHSPPCLGNGGSWIAGSRRLPLFPRKEGQARAELPHREPLTMHANRPLKDIACVLHAQTKDATVVCVIECQITRTRIHTLPKRLASARHSGVRKLYSYQIHSARFKQTSQWRRKSWWCILPAALILWYAGSDVMGCRRPTGGVFSYVSSDRVTLRAFPVATPRGRSSSSHEGETRIRKQKNIWSDKLHYILCFVLKKCICRQATAWMWTYERWSDCVQENFDVFILGDSKQYLLTYLQRWTSRFCERAVWAEWHKCIIDKGTTILKSI